MSLSSRVQLGGSALVEREQLIGNRPVVAVLASCVQTRVRRGSLPPFPGAKHSPHLCCFVWLHGQHRQQCFTCSAAVRTTVWAKSVPSSVTRIAQGKYVSPWPSLPPPTSRKWARKGLSPEVRKTVICNIGGRWNRGDCGTKGAKYFKHLLQACARYRIPDKMCHLSVLEWNFLCP